MSDIERVCQFLKDAGTYYLATVEGDQPRVRPFGTAHIFEGKLYIQTGLVRMSQSRWPQIRRLSSAHSTTAHG